MPDGLSSSLTNSRALRTNFVRNGRQQGFYAKMPLIGRPAARGAGLSPAPTRGELPVSLLRGDRARICAARGRPIPPSRSEGEPPLLRTPPGLARGQPAGRHRGPFGPRAERPERAP